MTARRTVSDAQDNGSPMPPRFYLLDILRGFASLAVVAWHYQHFFYTGPGELPADFDRSTMPLYPVLWLFYESGNHAVELFFVLSGFIFFWLYRQKVADGDISAWRFFVLRFSRLYPLHFATLLFVAAGQALSMRFNGEFIVYPQNDAWHFLLNLLFASHWGLQSGWSFNGPIWSVSVEVLLYAVFFATAVARLPAVVSIASMAALGLLILATTANSGLGLGMMCFFAGGAAYEVYALFHKRRSVSRYRTAATVVTVLLTISTALVARGLAFPVSLLLVFLVTFPALVLSLALIQDRQPELGKPFRIIGDITYSTYLLHFPLQLLIIGVATGLALHIDYRSPGFLIVFFAILIAVSVLVYRHFEKPTQAWLRKTMR